MLNERPQQKCHQHYDYHWKKTFIQLDKDWKETETINIYIYIYLVEGIWETILFPLLI